MAKKLENLGAKSAVPYHHKLYKVGKTIPCWSSWSERHVAYIAGLGTFGLHTSFITEKGASGRLDSIVTELGITPTLRTCKSIYDNCIKCFRCVRRCPVGAIKETGKAVRICAKKVLAGKTSPDKAVCGKCLTDVSCENCNPTRALSAKRQ
ncbi:MAG: 4Fe-4S binding protein [Verrucomicrobiae bacterium]|nr:4Fe-4S binding protein [Verrucomicrobiae bacterium]